MGECIDIRARWQEKSLKEALGAIDGLYARAEGIVEEYELLMEDDPLFANRRLLEYIRKARDVNPEPAYETMAGGPNQDWIAPLFNTLGTVYPYLEHQTRKEGLGLVLGYLDGLRYDYSQNHMELIHEPWLFSDIIINRWLYWPGFEREARLLAENRTWNGFQRHMSTAKSQFLLTFAVMKPKHSSLEVRTAFYKEFPDLVDRTMDGVAAIMNDEAFHEEEERGITYEEALLPHLNKNDPLLHEAIRAKIKEAKWITLAR